MSRAILAARYTVFALTLILAAVAAVAFPVLLYLAADHLDGDDQ